ncbi:Uncharacterised protein [Mycobacteroides abscessus subsp. abscessus]|nr:Uncharacterised protein [Mycobacteroides abscessus subsp. abscessus]
MGIRLRRNSIKHVPASPGLTEATGIGVAKSAAALLQHRVDQRAPVFVGVDEELRIVIHVGCADGVVEQVLTDLGDNE